jgi:aminoglycoside 6'-N-acetyltransferase
MHDLDLLVDWEQREHIRASIGDYDFNEWNWSKELSRNPPWRYQLIATTQEEIPIGFIQMIDPKEEETHYWVKDCTPNSRAIDIWIGEEEYRRKGYGTQMFMTSLQEYCFGDKNKNVETVLVDPLATNMDVMLIAFISVWAFARPRLGILVQMKNV